MRVMYPVSRSINYYNRFRSIWASNEVPALFQGAPGASKWRAQCERAGRGGTRCVQQIPSLDRTQLVVGYFWFTYQQKFHELPKRLNIFRQAQVKSLNLNHLKNTQASLVGGFNPSEKYSQYGKNVPNHQPDMLYVDVFCYRPVQYSGDTKGYESLSLLSAWAMIFKLPALKVLRASNMALVQLRGCLRCMKMYWTGHELLSKAARHEWTRKFAFRHSVVILHEIVIHLGGKDTSECLIEAIVQVKLSSSAQFWDFDHLRSTKTRSNLVCKQVLLAEKWMCIHIYFLCFLHLS